jgi:hypothetical protein
MLTRIHRGERGFVLVVVMLSLVLVLALITGVMNYAVGARDLSARDQDWNAALSAAEAGIDDYLFRLNQDGSYWRYGPPPDPEGDAGNLAFTTWVPVPGSASDASFRYTIDTASLAVDGTIGIMSTGRVGNVTRTIDASLRRRNFLDYLYFTDFETKDPAAYDDGDSLTQSQAQALCTVYAYAGRSSSCTEITFVGQDTVNGPLHTNDALRINGGPHFNGVTSSTYDPATGNRWIETPSQSPNPDAPIVANAGDPRYAAKLTLPPSNSEIKSETDPGEGGCLFTGPTAINVRNDGTIDVISPFTKVTNCTWLRTPATSMNNRYTTTRFTLPAEGGVIYVQNVPTSGDNGTAETCPYSQPAIGGNGGAGVVPMRTHPLGFPQKNDADKETGDVTDAYGCRNGDVFLQGTLNGRLTIAAENNIVLFGSTTYAGSDDLLGLVANNYVTVYHPVATSTGEGSNEVQTIGAIGNWSWGDRIRFSFEGDVTGSSSIQYPGSASAVQNALVSYTNLDSNDVIVTGPNGGPYTVTFLDEYGNEDVPMISVYSCTGCTSPTVTETLKGGGSGVSCDSGGTVGGYCNLRVPGITSPQAISLFNGATPGASTMATALYQYSNRGPSVSAAIVTVAHSFTVQNYDVGPDFATYGTTASKLTVVGAIAQKFRGAVGTFSGSSTVTGYAKNYNYDQRLKYDSPPKFLNPVASAWQVVTWAEESAAFDADAA